MTKRLVTMCLVTVFLVGVGARSARAQVYVHTLEGISTVFVVVENVPGNANVLRLTRESIQTDVELKLRNAGMRIVTPEEGAKVPGGPHLYVRVTLTPKAEAARFDVELLESARLERTGRREPSGIFHQSVSTWSDGSVIVRPTAAGVRGQIAVLVDRFLNAWLSVNPKK